jgi:hypothetical protein
VTAVAESSVAARVFSLTRWIQRRLESALRNWMLTELDGLLTIEQLTHLLRRRQVLAVIVRLRSYQTDTWEVERTLPPTSVI